jgi:large subunit ribosomal protein L15
MELNNLKPAEGSVKKRKRIGRGSGSGHGGTSTRGHKGAKSRSGYSKKFGFEGGQMPLQRRIPKFGFKNVNRVEFTAINLDVIQNLIVNKSIKEFNKEVALEYGLISKSENFKILGRGEISTAIPISANAFSKSAISAIEKVGGSVTIIK